MNLDWLKQIAPTLATALGGPLAGLAVSAVSKAMGIEDASRESVFKSLQEGMMTPEKIAQIKIAEMEMQKHEKELGFKFAELEVRDRESARNREATVKDSTNMILAYTVVGAFIAMVGATLLGYAKVESVLAGTLVGYLSAKAEQVLAYYFGSSSGSESKTNALIKSMRR